VDLHSPHSETSDYLPTHPVAFSGALIRRSTRFPALAVDEEIWERENVNLDAVLGIMSFSSWLASIEMGCNTHVSLQSLETPLVRFSLKAPDIPTAADLVHRYVISFLGGPAIQYQDLPNGETDCRVSGSSIMSLFITQQSWIMLVSILI
jgi:hypothetical protein